ncbi:hypothetical protein VKI22_04175 [Cyanobacterium aponinum UTEX 3221]|uniref:Uncharacterized protein n=2 Tax=Cyanobacterium aponinum TaxID=379064 RepID=A0A844GR88_9CHRO|nr:hypothetical protein [Cyanobacterium aponinum]MTF37591.1 hypothetical protein [Cyanobacterium aponinum 0216]WPF87435.1 hypothetical protein SAY89_11535 [Cyanobacterium aponinum AL20115]WRL39302.1 hypothetical protein VKI22_04175 [Cyanobacterium aponinum UTEX 3221]
MNEGIRIKPEVNVNSKITFSDFLLCTVDDVFNVLWEKQNWLMMGNYIL